MRPKKSAVETRFLVEKLFDELVAARQKLAPRRLLLLPNAHEHHPHLVGGYNFMTDIVSRPLERGKKKRTEGGIEDSGSETDQPELDDKGERTKRAKKKEKLHRPRRKRRQWMLLWEGEKAEAAEYVSKAVNMSVEDIDVLLEKEMKDKDFVEAQQIKLPSIRCAKWKSLDCSFKCQVTLSETRAKVMSLGAHRHEGKVVSLEPVPKSISENSMPSVVKSPITESRGENFPHLKPVRTEDLDVPISSPSLLPLPSTEEDNNAALKVLAAWKPPQPSSEEEVSDEGEDEAMGSDEENQSESKKGRQRNTLRQVSPLERVDSEERAETEDDEEDNQGARVNDHAMFTGFEPGFLETDETTTYHAIGTIGHDGRANESEEEEEGEEEGDV